MLPDSFDKYKLTLDEQFRLPRTTSWHYYHDLDHDGYSEAILRTLNLDGSSNFVVYVHSGGVIDQWNFKNPWVPRSELIFGDCNNNGLDEIFGFTWSGDSVFLEGIEIDRPDTICENLFIDRIAGYGDQSDFQIINGPVINVDDDDQKEILFAITTGFPLQPRNAYIYDPVKKELLKSPQSGSQVGGFAVTDLDDDGFMEIINTYSKAGHNIRINIPYNDSSAWLMVFDHRLQFKFEPVQFSGLWTSIAVIPVNKELFVRVANFGKQGGIPRVMRYDVHGNMLSEIYLDNEEGEFFANFFTLDDNPGRIFLSAGDDRMYEFDHKLNIVDQIQIRDKYRNIFTKDLDMDGKQELITVPRGSNQIIILRDDFSHPVVFEVESPYPKEITLRLNGDARPQFSLRSGTNQQYVFSYFENPMYVFQYPIWLGIYLMIAGFVWMVQRFQDMQNASKRKMETEMIRMQLTNVKNQFDPHFTFNALNSISHVMYKGDKDVAYDYLVRFSKLIRVILEDSDKILTSLHAEMAFITNYLELQKFRLNNKFDYQIDVASGLELSKIEVPKMIIQNYVENAVKHGLKNMQGKGMLKVLISKVAGKLQVVVEDNGIGMAKAREFSGNSTGKGLKLTSQFFQLYKRLYGKKITVKTEDLEKAGTTGSGTRVTLMISV